MNYSICQDCGCKTSRLIFCGECSNREKRLAQQISALNKPVAKTTKPKTKKVEVDGTITFATMMGDDYRIKNIEGSLKVGRFYLSEHGFYTCKSMKLDGVTMSHTSFKALFKSGVITEVVD